MPGGDGGFRMYKNFGVPHAQGVPAWSQGPKPAVVIPRLSRKDPKHHHIEKLVLFLVTRY